MSSSTSSSDSGDSQNDSEYNFIPGNVWEVEEGASEEKRADNESETGSTNMPYADEPLADEEWLVNYDKEIRENNERERDLCRRFDGSEPMESWCKCGYCHTEFLQSHKECYCCTEIDGCMAALNDALILEDVNEPPCCITLHPGFRVICLEKWSLRQAARKYKTRDNRKYRQTGTEAGFLRLVAYREFTYLVHGYLGNKRIPLPACTYHCIRDTFKIEKEDFTGFRVEDDE